MTESSESQSPLGLLSSAPVVTVRFMQRLQDGILLHLESGPEQSFEGPHLRDPLTEESVIVNGGWGLEGQCVSEA